MQWIVAEPRVPTQEAEPACGQMIGQVVLGEVDVVVGCDHGNLRPGSPRTVVDALAGPTARSRPELARSGQADERGLDLR